jgi:nucleotide-binding universal stress UspA family protein
MQTYRIVVGVDGSEQSLRALSWAVAEADRRGGSVQAVTAWQWTQPELGADVRVEYERTALATLEDAIALARRGHRDVTVAAEAIAGTPAEVLTRAAVDADLLVLGSHGHGRLFHAVLGSVAEQCIRAALCPVVVIPVPHPVAAPAEAPVGPITTATY